MSISASMGWYYVKQKHTGQVTLEMGKPLSNNRLIAISGTGERGLQSELIKPGYGYNVLYPFFMSIDEIPDFEVPAGKFAVLTARDGSITPKIVAKDWDELYEVKKDKNGVVLKDKDGTPLLTDKKVDFKKMIQNVDYFVENGGERGIQQYKLTTGIYRLNRHQWKNIELVKLTEVRANEVLVIESKFGKAPAFKETTDDEILSVPLVDSEKFRGIVNNAYPSGYYAIHPKTQEAHLVSIVLDTFIYGGGYLSKVMELAIDPDTDQLETVRSESNIPAQLHGSAFEAKTKDNHTVRYDVRVLGQIEPIQAPRFIGTIRDPKVLDDKVIEPFTRNILSNITLKYTALELKNQKEAIGELVSKQLRERTIQTGFRTKTVEITNIDIPAIVLIPGKIKSASAALKDALIEKEKSVSQAIKVRNMQDQADNQEELAKATVSNAAADQKASSITKLSKANKQKSMDESDAEAYKISQATAANKKRVVEMGEAYGTLAQQIGKDNAAAVLLQETINLKAGEFNGPDVVVYGNGADGGTSIVDAHMMSQSMRNSVIK